MAVDPRTGITLLSTQQRYKEQLINEGFAHLGAIATGAVVSMNQTSPPTDASLGEVYFVPSGATGIWAGHGNKLALRIEGGWSYFSIPLFQRIYSLEPEGLFSWSGTDWVALVSDGDMRKSVYDTNNDGVVNVAEVANSIDWENVQNPPTIPTNADQLSPGNNNKFVTQADLNKLNNIPTDTNAELEIKEDYLGNPTTNGYILSSTTAGVRSWIATNVPGSPEGSSPTDNSLTYTTASLASNSTEQTTLSMSRANVILNITSSRACRVRFYSSITYRNSDLNRAIGVDPTGEHGLLLDVVTSNMNLSIDCAPLPVVAALANGTSIPITITNLDTTTGTVNLTITYLSL